MSCLPKSIVFDVELDETCYLDVKMDCQNCKLSDLTTRNAILHECELHDRIQGRYPNILHLIECPLSLP